MSRRKAKIKSPLRQAANWLHENAVGTGAATAEQIMRASLLFDVEPWQAESLYLEDVERFIEDDAHDALAHLQEDDDAYDDEPNAGAII